MVQKKVMSHLNIIKQVAVFLWRYVEDVDLWRYVEDVDPSNQRWIKTK